MVWAMGAGVLAAMVVLALRADARFAAHDRLPMQFAPDLSAGWTAPRAVALGFLPGLAAAILLALALFAPDPPGAAIAGGSLLAGQVFYHWLLARSL